MGVRDLAQTDLDVVRDRACVHCCRMDIISVAELLAFIALAAVRAPQWKGRLVFYVTDNQTTRSWLMKRKAGNSAARHLLQKCCQCHGVGRGCELVHVAKFCRSGIAKSLFVRKLCRRSDCVRALLLEDVVFEHRTVMVRLRGREAETEFRTACFLRGWAVGISWSLGTVRL